MSFNLYDLDTVSAAEQGAVMEVEHPGTGATLRDTEGRAVTITLLGVDSEAYRKAQNKNLNRRLAKRNVKLSAEELEAEAIELLAGVTKDWYGITDKSGQALPCTRENAVLTYKALPWIREQADRFINDRSFFLAK